MPKYELSKLENTIYIYISLMYPMHTYGTHSNIDKLLNSLMFTKYVYLLFKNYRHRFEGEVLYIY